jgi:hypothetical protein
VIGLGALALFGAVFLSTIILPDPHKSSLFIGAVFVVLLAMTAGAIVMSATSSERIFISVLGVEVEYRTFMGPKRLRLSADEIEEVEIGPPLSRNVVRPGNVVSMRADRGLIEFGAGLSRAELAWMRDAVHHYLVKPFGPTTKLPGP